jgi:hypothetical protein
MIKTWYSLLMVLALTGSCKNSTEVEGEKCSVKAGGMEFTRSLNNAKSLATVDGGKLMLTSNARCDYFNDPD